MSSFFSILKQGQIYLQTWPLEAKLGMIFPENRIIKATKFAQKFMPFMAVFAVAWQQLYAKADFTAFSLAILTALCALAMPFQGLYWLGKRAKLPLEPQSSQWFYEISERLRKQHESLPTVQDKPTYQHLAEVLQKAQKKLDKAFWQEI
ncbi:MAG: terminus macrodomain insulation protein YfbV [Haemophilus parainfluenzae]|uniref:terminus macrodomain insulation protein YfbV n=1 Tax=uncultured Haemophilus sp. TaxID=237779 RepID=UPI002804B815|nr:terminus macrodomain insulation protein YfbV [uncultured Haemophilus sp.]MDU4566578.1 terminus macrodomain insulation protein YfbV [Haemophilus parainfluenzae]MDU4638471.1 terminus macrodomain insulation protein YfbV [Haemophilus parainfluenzae]MDU5991319.1 terminus macrodomain insulation protein YfbV [Haemophilus parainfluenzae]MDU7945204.1 terminus macrodomain insulation protein YfbV [Haemophilus parainfluenzae]MDU7970076.1 terminus macrodomain insulation protein YfbV [Haemophilus parainf